MTIPRRSTPDFWRLDQALPAETPQAARKNDRHGRAHPLDPIPHIKPFGKTNGAIRIGEHFRSIRKLSGDSFIWEWIGLAGDNDRGF